MQGDDYYRVERALRYLQTHYPEQPSLDEIARATHLSKYHFHRVFSRWAGITPHRFMQYLALSHAKHKLVGSDSVLDAAYAAGLSGPGRLHDLFVTYEAMTPGEFKQGGLGLLVAYGFHDSPFGGCRVAVTDRGVCDVAFVTRETREHSVEDLRRRWPRATLQEDTARTAPFAHRAFDVARRGGAPLHLLLGGTNFQIKVWEALLRVPLGRVVSYHDVARHIGQPGAARAVGQATAHNPIAFLIPCHRVIRSMGVIGNYRWGAERKQLMVAWEAAQVDRWEPGVEPAPPDPW